MIHRLLIGGLGASLATGVAAAAAAQSPAAGPQVFAFGQVLQTLLGLAVVIALIVAVAWAARRGLGLRGQGTERLRVLGGVALGTRERAVLIEVGARQLLVGVAPGRVQTLYVLEPDESVSAPETRPGGPFASRLSAARTALEGGQRK